MGGIFNPRAAWFFGFTILWVLAGALGCTRSHYFRNADEDAYGILNQKLRCTPWRTPAGYSVMPDPRSRFFDPSNVVDPTLPRRRPTLNAYRLPHLTRFTPKPESQAAKTPAENAAPEELPAEGTPAEGTPTEGTPTEGTTTEELTPQTLTPQTPPPGSAPPEAPLPGLTPPGVGQSRWTPEAGRGQASRVILVGYEEAEDLADLGGLRVVPLEQRIWESLPASCLTRMLEFPSVEAEYVRSFNTEALQAFPRDESPRLTLPAIMELALINSRQYQTQKEQLYRAALRLSFNRYDYDLLFLPRGNGNVTSFRSERVDGPTTSFLNSGTTVGVRKISRTGADLLSSFANDVLVTFNGQGVSTRVGSRLLFTAVQSLLQRDIIFENLTQAERDVVYAARDFTRFRKQFFRDFADRYYSLLLTYRGIEIDAQDYFTNQRGFAKAGAEYQAGRLPRFQVDQFEQNALRSRSNLISSCNALEGALDAFKIQLGLPPEMPLNVDLTELEELTRRDSLTAAAQLATRKQLELRQVSQEDDEDLGVRVNTAMELTRRLLRLAAPAESAAALENISPPAGGADAAPTSSDGQPADAPPPEVPVDQQTLDELRRLLSRLAAAEAKLKVAFNSRVLADELQSDSDTPPLRLFQRAVELMRSLLDSCRRQLALSEDSPTTREARQRVDQRSAEVDALVEQLSVDLREKRLDRLNALAAQASQLLEEVRRLATELNANVTDLGGVRKDIDADIVLLFDAAQQLQQQQSLGLPVVEIERDAAMLTAVSRRYDLANERERLADAWRQIKLRGDALRSNLTLEGRYSLRTRLNGDTPFGFTFENSSTEIGLSYDAPLNRLAERNAFRQALIDYNAQWRNVMEAEDLIKLSVRNTLRALQLDREQYDIAVASAALAYERVVSTRLQLQQAAQNITARDFLEAQQAYTASLNTVARARIGYIVDRIQLFLDLEQLQVDALGFWPQLYDEKYAPQPRFDLPLYCGLPYGELADSVIYSRKMLRMLEPR